MTHCETDLVMAQADRVIAADRAAERAARLAQAAETRVAAHARKHGLSLLTAMRSSHADGQVFRRHLRQNLRFQRRARRASDVLASTPASSAQGMRAKLLAACMLSDSQGLSWEIVRSVVIDLRRLR